MNNTKKKAVIIALCIGIVPVLLILTALFVFNRTTDVSENSTVAVNIDTAENTEKPLGISDEENPSEEENAPEPTALKEIYKDYFLIGNVFSPREIPGARFEFMKEHFNVLTAENAMKPDAMQKAKGNFTFKDVDAAIEQILASDIQVHGHTLAWHNQSPPWLNKNVTREEAEQNLAAHVNGVAGHYAGKILSWDVLNEAVNDAPSNPENWRSALRKTDWYTAFAQSGDGEDYIYELFKLAREADPNAVLYYNDYNLNNRFKALAVYSMVKELNEKYLSEGNDRLLIEGIGMQGHYSVNTVISEVEESIKLFIGLGVKISITELDVTVNGAPPSGLEEEDEIRQGIVYAQLFNLFKKYADNIERVTLWGLDDRTSWRANQFPMLFNGDLSPKLAYYAVANPDSFLEKYSTPEIEIKKRLTGKAAYGTPDIDGSIDDIWQTAEELPIDQMLQAWQTASGKARILWDEEFLYVLAEISDASLDNSSSNVWEQDTVEIFVDEKNCKSGEYRTDDGQYRICYDGTVSFGSSTDGKGFVAQTDYQISSYIIEMKIPFKAVTPQEGMVIGFDAQINDAKNGSRAGMAKWNDPTNDSYISTSGWGEVELVGAR